MISKLDFETWFDLHIDDLAIKFAESGADRELDFNFETEAETEYFKYYNSHKNQLKS